MADVDSLMRLHDAAKARLQDRVRELLDLEASLKSQIDACLTERRRIEAEARVLGEAEHVYRKIYGWASIWRCKCWW